MSKLYTSRVYWYKKIKERFPDAELINIQRKPWQYTPSWIPRKKSLGPLIELLEEAKTIQRLVLSNVIPKSSEKGFQDYYSKHYIEYLKEKEAQLEVNEIIQKLMLGQDIILLCSELPGQFCHRTLLHDFICSIVGQEFTGHEIEFKEDE